MSIERLSAEDRLLLHSDRTWPQDVGVVLLLERDRAAGRAGDPSGEPSVARVREVLARGVAGLPRLRQVLRVPARGLGGPYWIDAPAFDLADHVRLGPRVERGSERDLLRVVEELRRRRLDPTRPLWEVWLLSGLDLEPVAMFVRMHHVIADGVAGIATLAALLGGRPLEVPPEGARLPTPEPSRGELLADSLRRRVDRLGRAAGALRHPRTRLRAGAEACRALLPLVSGEPGPVTSLTGLVGPGRRLEVVNASLAEVEQAADAAQATVNDVLLDLIAGGLRALLTSRGEPVDGLSLPILVPVSLRRGGGAGAEAGALGNFVSQLRIDLPVAEPDAVTRLRRITAATSRAKAMSHPSLGSTFRNRVVSAILLRLVIRQCINLLSADIVGPARRLSFAGATVTDAFPLINLLGNVTLGVGALSYAGRFDVLAVADADLFPDLEVFAAGLAEELTLLGSRTGLHTG